MLQPGLQRRGRCVRQIDRRSVRAIDQPTLAALRQLLDAQKSRLDQARAIGANIIAVERLNALEQQAFSLASPPDKTALAGYLGLIEDFTGKIAVVLDQLGGQNSARASIRQRRCATTFTASNRTRCARLPKPGRDAPGHRRPLRRVDAASRRRALRERFSALADEARAGNDSALQALGQVGQQRSMRAAPLWLDHHVPRRLQSGDANPGRAAALPVIAPTRWKTRPRLCFSSATC